MRPLLPLLLWVGCAGPAPRPAAGPNIVFILADDLGHGDLGCQGAPDLKTPSIDRLAAEGVRFTQFYAGAPECTPTRTALLTGRYPQRVGGLECAIGTGNVGRYDDAIRLRSSDDLGLPPSESVLPRLLKHAGYATAVVGKWHLGYAPKFFPARHGFDAWFGPLGGGVDYFHHTEPDGSPMLYRDGTKVRRDGYLTDLLAEEASAFVRRTAGPFFLYVPFTAPHLPGQGPDDRRPVPLAADAWGRCDRATYVAMVERLDRAVGEILKALDETGRAKDTLVVFTSDNGGAKVARNAPFTGHKGGTYEGGLRVPCLARWPGLIPAGTTAPHVATTMDLTASLLRAAGATPDRPLDGVDILAAIGGPPQPRTLFWRQRRGDTVWRAVRDGDLKYLSREEAGRLVEERLSDVSADPAEATDLLGSRPGDGDRLRALLARWQSSVVAAR